MDSVPQKRKLRPRPSVAVRASFVSQENCLPLLGVDARRYLDLVVPRCKGEVVSLGKLRLVPLDVAEHRLRELAANSGDDPVEPADEKPSHAGIFESAEDVLRALGRRRVAR